MEHGLGCRKPQSDPRDFRVCAVPNYEFPESFELKNMPRVKDQGRVNSCHDKETEVLTKKGWKLFNNVTYEDELASIDPQSGDFIYEKPTNIIKEKYCGEMIIGKHESLDFKVTPNHKMIVNVYKHNSLRTGWDKYISIDAKDLKFYQKTLQEFHYNCECETEIHFPEEKIANGNILKEFTLPMEVWVKFLGIYLAEGTAIQKGPESHWKIQLAAYKKREKDFISELLKAMCISNRSDEYRFQFCNKRIWKKLEEYKLIGVKSYEKFVPDFIFDLDERYIKDFIYGYMMGDGSQRKNGFSIASSSKTMVEQLSQLMWMCGLPNSIKLQSKAGEKHSFIEDREIINKHDLYIIYTRTKNVIISKNNISTEPYNDYVYCAEVPTYHTLLTRRNGKVLLSGNCCAHAASTILEYYNRENLSTEFIYGIERSFCGDEDQGMYMVNACKIVKELGDMLEEDCKGNHEVPMASEFAERASKDQEKLDRAKFYCVEGYYRCNTSDDIKFALMNHGPILGCIFWDSIYNVDSNGIVNFGVGKPITNEGGVPTNGGYHAIVIYGWTKDGWMIQNSWGDKFANRGRFILPFKYEIPDARALIEETSTNRLGLIRTDEKKTSVFKRILNKIFKR